MVRALLLAGGRSSRMGQDKASLVYRGKSLLDRAHDLLVATGCGDILLSGRVEGRDSVPDLIPDCGPLGGLHGVLHHLDGRGELDGAPLLVIPVDMPLLSPSVLKGLLDALGDGDICRYEDEVFPCVFRASRELLDTLDALFADSRQLGGARSMKALLAGGNAVTLARTSLPGDCFLNLNNPADWQRFLAEYANRE